MMGIVLPTVLPFLPQTRTNLELVLGRNGYVPHIKELV